MAQEQINETVELAKVTNVTDPKVKVEPKFEHTTVVKRWMPQDKTEEGAAATDAGAFTQQDNVDMTRIDGVLVPIVQINTMVIPWEEIVSMKLSSVDFVPTVNITVKKTGIERLSIPGMASKITVIMIPPEDGTYNKISADFYISNASYYSDTIAYTGEYMYPALEATSTRAVHGVSNTSSKLTTYEFLESIASECQLGFSATDMCEDVADVRTRLLQDQNFKEAIQEHMKFSGIDENSIMDAWIDPRGHITLINKSWVLSKSIEANELSHHMLEGFNSTDAITSQENGIHFGDKGFRLFTNLKAKDTRVENGIESYKWIVNNHILKSKGSENTFYALDPIVNGGSNSISSLSLSIDEDTADGKNFKGAYAFHKNVFLGTEMGNDGNAPILYQTQRRKNFMNKLEVKKLKVVLDEMNLGLLRGMLVTILIFEYERSMKMHMLRNYKNLSPDGNTDVYSDNLERDQEILENNYIGVPNYTVSGIYLIDGLEYTYDIKDQKIKEVLYLVKQNDPVNYFNHSSVSKLPGDIRTA